jgi:hypothetical protein
LRSEERLELVGGQCVSIEDERNHDLITHPVIGEGVHRDLIDLWQPMEDPLDRSGGQVLPVDAHPVGGAPGQIDPTDRVSVSQVA